jgi:hypothetical protein
LAAAPLVQLGARVQEYSRHEAQGSAAELGLRQGKRAPAELVDSMGVPARFYLWIPKDLERALNVFSFQVQPAL